MMMRGRTCDAHVTTYSGWLRSWLLLGRPPFALEWCVQLGLAHRTWTTVPHGTRSPGTASSILQSRVVTFGKFARIVLTATSQWLIESPLYFIPRSVYTASWIPSSSPPIPQNRLMMLSTVISSTPLDILSRLKPMRF